MATMVPSGKVRGFASEGSGAWRAPMRSRALDWFPNATNDSLCPTWMFMCMTISNVFTRFISMPSSKTKQEGHRDSPFINAFLHI